MAWVSPVFPRADRPELLGYYLSAIIYLVSRTFYGPQILSIFCERFFAILRNFPSKKNREKSHTQRTTFASTQDTPCPKDQLFSYFLPDRLKNLIFTIKLLVCGSNEGSTVFLG